MFDYTALYTDKYQLTMAQVYYLKGHGEYKAVFDYFFRKLPFDGGYAVFAGLRDLLHALEHFHFDEEDLNYLKEQGFNEQFLKYLKHFRFKGDIYACKEGELIFPLCPVIRVEGTIIEAQIIETILLNIINFQSLIATKASRIRYVADSCALVDFGLRRAQGPGGYYASRAAIIGGFDATSNLCTGRDYHIETSGTMAHSYIQSYDSELEAFEDFSKIWPDHCVLLVDTYHSLESGIPNAIKVAKKLEKNGHRLQGIRLDSGDLAYLAKMARHMLNDAGLDYVKIIASNQLDEHVIKSLMEQGAPIDIFGVGTNLVTGHPDAALDGVYKLSMANYKSRIKLSDNLSKITLPDRKQVLRILNRDNLFLGADVIALEKEEAVDMMLHPYDMTKSLSLTGFQQEALLNKVMENGKDLTENLSLKEIQQYFQLRFKQLPDEYKRFDNPHLYKVGLSSALKMERDELLNQHRKFL
ncbi:nicotinate phosphoribosyltransferase [Legionella jordanis]|uniref:Nicotinate phosphoribosyltransferase n=1 Tax=Legionella jordanis TaxID=456 RepID=A0A0W0VB14_9GAMM|nr:nicotinate phosphoribosyltransferase [Legionella jordanis]KTD17304.1 nicotinate phosphoribosyltransferase [Legionella jordanis]RMW99453.1 nicotinate phosphoribosyltransferase [Legionella jordanis]RMX15302.1 nicotinate phosphoribosyltransferase [Legionella jordanis]VEH12497.1 nicotinate phosphoribosyltransferase [Legionella jordanis]HAT8715223.1 nicotinate phosphoribosyltransferase [Legionella jordanis]